MFLRQVTELLELLEVSLLREFAPTEFVTTLTQLLVESLKFIFLSPSILGIRKNSDKTYLTFFNPLKVKAK